MIPAHVNIAVDDKVIKEYIQQQIDQSVRETFLLVDLEKLVHMTNMSARFLEDNILSDPRMRLLERRKARKRWWLYKESMEVIKEILEDW